MRILYFFVKDVKTGKKSMIITDEFLGEIKETIVYNDIEYIIEDYAEEMR